MGGYHNEKSVDIHVVGTCGGKRDRGGWAAVLKYGHHEKELSGGEPGASADRMDLTASVRALESLKWPCPARVRTTSTYVRDGVTDWLPRWRGDGWRTHGQVPANVELWQRLDSAVATHSVSWDWIDAHVGDADLQRVERLAITGMRDTVNAEPADEECEHLMPIAWCSWCKPPGPGILPHGYRTAAGDAYHNDPRCEWLLKGQRRAFHQGKKVHDIIRVAWGSVNPDELQPCEACCTWQWLDRHGKGASR